MQNWGDEKNKNNSLYHNFIQAKNIISVEVF